MNAEAPMGCPHCQGSGINPDWTLQGLVLSRKRLGIRQKEVAREMGVLRATLAYWETGKRHISAEQMYAYGAALDAIQQRYQLEEPHGEF